MENTVYQRSDLLHRADDSQDNYSQPKQQAENGSSECVRTNTQTHKEYTAYVCMSDSSTVGSVQAISKVEENKAYCPQIESLFLVKYAQINIPYIFVFQVF